MLLEEYKMIKIQNFIPYTAIKPTQQPPIERNEPMYSPKSMVSKSTAMSGHRRDALSVVIEQANRQDYYHHETAIERYKFRQK